MPNNDGTGPFGDGRPGRGLGPCGRFRNFFLGGGRRYSGNYPVRRRRRFIDYIFPSLSDDSREVYPYDESNLQARKKDLEQELNWVENQLKDSKKGKE